MPTSPRRKGWSAKLARPLPLHDGIKLRTLTDARTMILERIPADKLRRNEWQCAARLLMKAAESGNRRDVEAATNQVELALFLNGQLRLQ